MPATYNLGHAQGTITIDTSDLTRASAAFTSVGKGLLGIGAAAAAGFGIAVKTAADFEKTIDAAGAVLGKTAKQMEPVAKLAMEIGKQTKFGAIEVAAGIEELAKAGLTIDQILGGAAEATANLAAASGNMGLEEASTIAVNAMKTFGLSADQLNHVADSLAGAANASTLEVDDLAVSMRYAGGTAKAMGVSIDEMNTVLAILGDRGIRGSTAGTSLRGVLLSLSPTSEKAAKMMQRLGLITEDGTNKFFDATGAMKPMKDVMQILGDATRDLSEEQRVQAFNVIFQRRAMASALFMAEAGAKGFDNYAAAIANVSAADVAAAKLDNLAGDMEKLKSEVESALITAGAPFQEQLREWTRGLTKLVKAFSDLSPETQKNIMKILAYTAVAFTAMGATSLFIGQIIKFVGVMQQVVTAAKWINSFMPWVGMFAKLKSGFETFRLGLMYAKDGLKATIPVVRAFTVSLLTNPIFLVAAAVIALGVGLYVLYKKWEPFQKFVDKAWQSFQVGWDMLLNFAKDLGGKVANGFKVFLEQLRNLREDAGNIIGGVIEWFKLMPGRIVNFITLIPGRVLAVFDSIWDAIYESVSTGIGAVVNFFAMLPERIAYILSYMVGFIIGSIAKTMMTFVRLVGEGIEITVDFFKKLPGRVISSLDKLWDGIWAFGEQTVQFFKELPGKVIAFVDKWWDDMYSHFMVGKAIVIQVVQDWFNATLQFFKGLPGNVIAWVNKTWDDAYRHFMIGKDIVIEVVKQWFNSVLQWFKDLPGNVISAVDSLWDRLWETMRGIGVRGYEGIKEGANQIITFMKELPQKILDALGNVKDRLFEKFRSIGSSAWEGFKKGLFGSPKTKIQYALEDLLAYTKTFNTDMGSEMAKLHSMSFDKFQGAVVGAMTPQFAGVGAGAGASTTNYNDNSKLTAQAAPGMSTMELAKDIIYTKRVRLYT